MVSLTISLRRDRGPTVTGVSEVGTRSTRRLRLRTVTPEDLPAVLAIETDPMTNQHRPGGPPSAEDVEKHLRIWVQVWREQHIGYWLAEDEQGAVGLAGLRPLTLHDRSCWNLYYRFSPRAWGHGLATERHAKQWRSLAR